VSTQANLTRVLEWTRKGGAFPCDAARPQAAASVPGAKQATPAAKPAHLQSESATPARKDTRLTCESVMHAAGHEPAQRRGAELLYHCPHPEKHKNRDEHPSFNINAKKNVWACFPCGAGGTPWQLVAFLAGVDPGNKPAVTAWLREHGLLAEPTGKAKGKPQPQRVAEYVYTDAQGNPLARKVRLEPGVNGRKKDFVWERIEGGKWVSGLGNLQGTLPLYRISKIVNKDSVIVTEGEKDSDAGAKIGLDTCTSGGTGSCREDHSDSLRGKDVTVIADADEPGRIHAQKVAASLYGRAASVKVCEIPGANDLADAIAQGWTRERLQESFDSTPDWQPATIADTLNAVMGFVRRYVSLTEAQARAVGLWVVHTHALGAAASTPYLAVNSAEKQSGKTRLLEVLRLLVFAPWFTGGTTKAALVRKVELCCPSLLLDESDAIFKGDPIYAEAVRGVLNHGYRRGGVYTTCIGQGAAIEPHDFAVFCPKAIAGIGRLPDTVEDRSIPIRLKRAKRGTVERFRERDTEREARELQAKLGAWASANLDPLKNARPNIPPQLSDRQADCCEPLLAIADLAGGEWPKGGRTALVELCGDAQADDDSLGVRLLQDVRGIFAERQIDEIASAELSEALAKIETSPWGEWSHGKPISPARLARMLKPFGISPDRIGDRDSRTRGYKASQFQDAFSRYLPPESVHPSTTRENSGDYEDLKVSTKEAVDTSENAVSPAKNAACGHVDTLKPVPEAQELFPPPPEGETLAESTRPPEPKKDEEVL
jgi:hypothetical protein